MTKFCRIEEEEGGRILWLELKNGGQIEEVKAVTWTYGETNIILTIPHAGNIGSDTTPAGNLLCASGNIIKTRIGGNEHPIKTYARDAGTDLIGYHVSTRLETFGLRPHTIECHLHRSKVECNRSLDEIAVEQRGQEAQEILDTYHGWIQQAIGYCKAGPEVVPGTLLIDLHGHGHPHEYIELGYRLTSELLNKIANIENEKRTWKSVMTSSARHVFTLRHLVRRKFGANGVEDALIGPQSFPACLSNAIIQCPVLTGIKSVPSVERPSPGKLGYYIGGHTVREHSKEGGVDCIQIELPLSVRTKEQERRDGISQVLADALLEFYNLHYRPGVNEIVHYSSPEESDSEDSDMDIPKNNDMNGAPTAPPPPPPPPPAMVSSNGADGISHMSMMAKSRMHEELVKKATARHLGIKKNSPSTSTQEENSSSIQIEELLPEQKVQSQIKELEKKFDIIPTGLNSSNPPHREGNESLQLSKKTTSNSAESSELAEDLVLKPAPKPKLYDSIFADKTLSEKEKLRREFLFGLNTTKPETTPQTIHSPETKKTPDSPKIPLKTPEKDAAPPTQKNKEQENLDKKKKCCSCQIL